MLIRLIAILAAACAAAGAARAQSPDTILLNGKIVTLDAKSSVVQALAIRDGRIVAVGHNASPRDWS
jgi:predicted amidohydrolase YtcJ